METDAEERPAVSTMTLGRSQDWVHHVINLLDAAMHQLYRKEKAARGAILQATSLLRQQIDLPAPQEAPDERGRLLAWQARKVRDYIDGNIAGPVLSRISPRSFSAAKRTSRDPSSARSESHRTPSSCDVAWNGPLSTCLRPMRA